MKKLIATGILLSTLVPLAALSASTSPLSPSYRAVYCYPGGTYWQKQIAAYPDYYASHDAYYVTRYGAATRYCPA